jgi:hypothetical protein
MPPAARILWAALVATMALRALAALLPGRALWGIDLGRDLPPAAFWIPWAATALALLPPVGRALASLVPATPRGTAVAALALAALAAVLAWSLPDALRFTGDSGMRHGAFTATEHPRELFPQAMPGDLWLHWALPRALAERAGWPAEKTNRALGAALAFANGVLAWRLARTRGALGAPALAMAAIAGWTAALALFSGYAKALVEVAVLGAAAAVALLEVCARGRGVLALGAATAAAIVMHRLGLLLLPAWLVGLAIGSRSGGWRRVSWLAGAALPVAALVWLGPRLAATLTGFDATHHLAAPGASAGALLASRLAPARALDVANLLLLLVPSLTLSPSLARDSGARPVAAERFALGSLLLPALAAPLVLSPQQGLFRDWDVFALTGVALACWLAVRVGERLARERTAEWLAAPIVLAAVVPAAQWLWLQADAAHGEARARAILAGPPARAAAERAAGWDRLALIALDHGDGTAMAEACSLAVSAAPSPRLIAQWGMAETLRGRPGAAQERYLRAAHLSPDFTLAWKGVAAASSALGDRATMARAVSELERLDPQGETTRAAAEWLERNRPAAMPH